MDILGNPAQPPGVPTISEGGAAQSTTFSAEQGFSANTFGTLAGMDFTQVTLTWDDAFVDGVAPTSLGGARVFYDGEPAFISFVGRGEDIGHPYDQINFIVPDTNTPGAVEMAMIEVETAGGRSAPVFVMHRERSPTLFPMGPFTRDPQAVAAVHLDGVVVGPPNLLPPPIETRGVKAGDTVSIFGTGFGPTSPAVPVGTLPGTFLDPGVVSETTEDVRICFGNTEVTPLFAGLSGFAGLYQFVVTIPDLSTGDVPLLIRIAGLETQPGMSIHVIAAQ